MPETSMHKHGESAIRIKQVRRAWQSLAVDAELMTQPLYNCAND